MLEALKNLSSANVLVIGDVMLDRYWSGDVDRISPEAPVPIVSVASEYERLGGAANVASNLAGFGARATLMGITGDDEAGERVRSLLQKQDIRSNLVVEDGENTTSKLRVISRNQQLLRADFERQPSSGSVDRLNQLFADAVRDYDAVVFSDYGKGSLARIGECIQVCRQSGIPALIDPKHSDYTRYRGASVITPNLSEFRSASRSDAHSLEELSTTALELLASHDLSALLITLSERGMVLVQSDGDFLHSPARAREVFDVSGAGDTVIAVMAAAMAVQLDMKTALLLSNAAASVVVSKLGTATASVEEIQQALERQKLEDSQ
ncbi:MAG: D-glycero-beta-D-manno-heptose-7-phosphate kinase [Pseudomonadota bacterium]